MNEKNLNDCSHVSGLIIEYIDGELDKETAALVENHICSCSDCRKLFNDMSAVCRAAAESAYDVPAGLHCRILDSVKGTKDFQRRRRMKKISAFAGIGAAAVICVSVGVTAFFASLSEKQNNTWSKLDSGDRFSIKATDDSALKLALNNSQFTFNKIAPDKEMLLENGNKSIDKENENGEPQPEGKPEETYITTSTPGDTIPVPQTTGVFDEIYVPPEEASERGLTSAESAQYGMLPYGKWELKTESGAIITLMFSDEMTFSIVDTYGNLTEGTFAATGNVLTFTYSGGSAQYEYVVADNEMGLSHISGASLIR